MGDEKLTPEMIQALVEAGKLTLKDLSLLTPDEATEAKHALLKQNSLMPREQMESLAMGTGGGGLAVAGKVGGAMKSMLPKAGPAMAAVGQGAIKHAPKIGSAIGGAAGAMVNHPFLGRALGYMGGDKVKQLLTKAKGSAPGVASNVERVAGPMADRASQIDNIMESVPKGVQLRPNVPAGSPKAPLPKPAYPSNITTESSMDDLLEMILRSTSQGSPSPLMIHNSAPEGLRRSIDAAKRVKRRSPR